MMRMRKLEKDGKLEERMVRRPILNHTHRVDGSRPESLLVSNWTETLRLRLTWMGARENLGEETGKLTGQKRRLRPRSSVSRSTFLLFVRQDLFLSLFKFFFSLQVFFSLSLQVFFPSSFGQQNSSLPFGWFQLQNTWFFSSWYFKSPQRVWS